MTTTTEFNDKLNLFVDGIRGKIDAYWAAQGYEHGKPTVFTEDGRRYVKVVKDTGNQLMVWGFIDKTNGDVLKAAGWKAPAKHARGNILTDLTAALANCEWTGPRYLR